MLIVKMLASSFCTIIALRWNNGIINAQGIQYCSVFLNIHLCYNMQRNVVYRAKGMGKGMVVFERQLIAGAVA